MTRICFEPARGAASATGCPMIWPVMARLLPHLVSIALVVCAVATAAPAQTVVNFTSLDGTTQLTAHLSRPEGDAPRPAVVLMHGCSGLLLSLIHI